MSEIKKSPWQDEQCLRRLYSEKGLTQEEIADKLGCSSSCIAKWMRKHGVETGSVSGSDDRGWTDESKLKQLLHDEGLNQKEAGERLGCSLDTIRYWRNKYGIKKHTPVSDRQHELLTGALMGDGSVSETKGNPKFVLSNTSVEFLDWFYQQFPHILNEPHLVRTAAESARQTGGDPDDYNPYYAVVGSHPSFRQYRDWYGDEGKRYPKDLELTPLLTKVWYAGDGSLIQNEDWRPYATFTVANEMDRADYLVSLFEEHGFSPRLSHWTLRFGVDDTERLLDWMGEPVPGYEYKWSKE